MKIKIAILDEDKKYVKRLSDYLSLKFNDRVELSVFSNQQAAEKYLKEHRIEVLLIDENMNFGDEGDSAYLKLYLTENFSISEIRGVPAICKYQKVEDMYKWVMQQYSNHVDNTVGILLEKNGSCKNIQFCAYGNGAGATTLSIAFSLYLVRKGHSVFYMNLEQFSSMYAYFEDNKDGGFSDLLYSIKSNKGNTVLKAESFLKKHESGIQYINAPSHPMDLVECCSYDVTKLFQIIRDVSKCEYFVIDSDYSYQDYEVTVMKESHLIILPDDGSESSNLKLIKLMDVFQVLEDQMNFPFKNKARVVYNKFSTKSSEALELDIKDIGGCPNIVHSDFKTVVEQLSRNEIMNKLYYESGGEK